MRVQIVFILLSATLVAAPLGALDPARELTQYSHRIWQDELPQNSIHTVLQTSDGYIWFGTYEGLVRFDGVRFVVFEAEGTAGLPGNTVLHLEEGRDRHLWISTNLGLSSYLDGRFTGYDVDQGLPDPFVNTTAEADDGSLWISTSAGVCRLADGEIAEIAIPGVGVGDEIVLDIEAVTGRTLWMATTLGLLLYDDGEITRFAAKDILPETQYRVLEMSRDGSLWIGTDQGLIRRTASGNFERHFCAQDGPCKAIRAIHEDSQGTLWIGTEQSGLFRFKNGLVDVFDSTDGLSHNYVRSITEDVEGSLWVGTNGGFNQFRDAKFVSYSIREGLANDYARSVFPDRDGAIWVGSDGGGVDRLMGQKVRNYATADGLPNASVRSIAQTSDGVMWFGTRVGVGRLEGGRFTSITTADGLSNPLVRVVYTTFAGDVWVGTENGLNRIRGRLIEVFTTNDGLAGNDVRALYEDQDHGLWVGTFNGVSRFKDGLWTTFRTEDGLSSKIVFTFYEDPDVGLWIGTDHGLNLYRNSSFTSFTREVGLFDNKYFSLLADDFGYIWTSSNKGISRVSAAALRDLGMGASATIEAQVFGASDGMRTSQCNGASQPAGCKDFDGHLWFPTPRGVVEITPDNLRQNPVPPPVLIEEMLVGDSVFDPRQAAKVPAGSERYEFHYTALSYAAPEKVFFRYRLADAADMNDTDDTDDADNSHEEWVDVGTRRVAYFTHLPPGRFEFRVQACNEDGVWNKTGASFFFEVEPSLWQMWWLRLSLVVLSLGLVLGFIRMRVHALARTAAKLEQLVLERTNEVAQKNLELSDKINQLEVSERHAHLSERRALEANRAKSVFLSNMSHELRTPLNSIIGFASILKKKVGPSMDDRSKKFLDNIHNSGEHLLGLINDILDLSKIEAGRLEIYVEAFEIGPVLEEVRRVMQGISHRKNISIEIEPVDSLPRVVADRSKLKQVLFNLISNAVKFSAGGSRVIARASLVEAAASPLEKMTIRIDVIDQGIGIAQHHQELIFEEFRQIDGSAGRQHEGTGLGLALVKRLIALQGGAVTVDSELNRGSTFSIYLPQLVDVAGGTP